MQEELLFSQQKRIPCSEVLSDCYGICSHITRAETDYPYLDGILDLADELGVSWIRSDLDWHTVCKKPGEFDFSLYDDMFAHIEKHPNIHLLPIISLDNRYFEKKTQVTAIEYRKEWEEYVKRVIERYHEFCPVWEGPNEWDYLFDQNYLTYNEGAQILHFIQDLAQSCNQDTHLLAGSLCGLSPFQKFISFDTGKSYAAGNLHRYTKHAPETSYLLLRDIFVETFKELGYTKPLWITECGWSTATEYEEEGKFYEMKTEREQAYLIPRIFLTGFSVGIEKMFLFSMRSKEYRNDDIESFFGITHADLSPKPAFYSYKNLIRMLPPGSSRPELFSYNKLFLCRWMHPTLGKVYAIWKENGSETIRLRTEGDPHYYRYDNIEREIEIGNSSEIKIGEEIIYIIGADAVIPQIKL